MNDDPIQYRKRADAERATAETATLPNLRIRALRSAERWEEMAMRAERVKVLAAERNNPKSA
ncbi:hypothetical protein GCM10008023_37410 [Sphingomonas glacialis]|uniref:Uncharacterized protein n=2 Tax=Sphingomonas glacialis TaxID=658225 RepID=A0ABQ3LSV9_9SPHN|nr:hypothetical protein GCM10008023_37410 [Sphingomonas glacialis]